MRGRREFAVLMGMRTGKTKVVLDDWGEMADAGETRDLLVVAPGGAYRTWERAIDDHLSEDMRSRTLVHTWNSSKGSAVERRRVENFLATVDPARPRALLVNVEAISSVPKVRVLMEEFLRQRPAVFAVDESTTIKRFDAKRTRFINGQFAPLAPWKRIMSGLPTPKSPLDLYSQFDFLNWRILGFRSFYVFRARYADVLQLPFGEVRTHQVTGEQVRRKVAVVNGYKNVEELWGKIEPYSFRKLLADCYDVPKTMYLRREVALTPEQERIYRDLLQFCTAALNAVDYVTATMVITQMLRLHQLLCGHTRDEQGKLHQVDERRTDALVDVLQEYDGKAIVWCSYDESIDRVYQRLEREFGEGCAARFWGGNRATREAEERRFKEDPSCSYMIATQSAGGMGRTWDVADLMVYYSSTDNLEHRSQSEERTSAVGKTRPTTVVDLVVPGTVDDKILQALREKIDLAATVTGDNWRAWVV